MFFFFLSGNKILILILCLILVAGIVGIVGVQEVGLSLLRLLLL